MRIYKVMASEGDWEQPLEELLTFAIMRETDKGMSEGFRKALGTFKGVSSEEIDWWCQSYIDNGKWRYVEPMSWLNLMQYTEPNAVPVGRTCGYIVRMTNIGFRKGAFVLLKQCVRL